LVAQLVQSNYCIDDEGVKMSRDRYYLRSLALQIYIKTKYTDEAS
jgi:hypothetical protein